MRARRLPKETSVRCFFFATKGAFTCVLDFLLIFSKVLALLATLPSGVDRLELLLTVVGRVVSTICATFLVATSFPRTVFLPFARAAFLKRCS